VHQVLTFILQLTKLADFPDAHVRAAENIYVYLRQLARDGE
jgi:hypothetical protein